MEVFLSSLLELDLSSLIDLDPVTCEFNVDVLVFDDIKLPDLNLFITYIFNFIMLRWLRLISIKFTFVPPAGRCEIGRVEAERIVAADVPADVETIESRPSASR